MENMTHKIPKITLDGVEIVAISDFALLIGKSQARVHKLIKKGNVIRKLKTIVYNSRLYVPYAEYWEFPFTTIGRKTKVYNYDKDTGEKIFNEEYNNE